MATVTVSALGGNWSSTTTWVGAAIPAVGDDIVANATSGPLTVDSNRTCLTINFTGYTNTFTINNGITLTVTGTFITLGSGMTYTQGTTGVLSTISNTLSVAIAFAGITIPRLTLGRISGGNTQTVTISGTTPTIQNLLINNGFNAATALSGTAITITSSLSVIGNFLTNNTGQITFTGTCTINCASSLNTISGGFNVTTGSSLQMLNNIYLAGGTVSFTGTATLINTGLFTLFCSTAITFNTSTVNWYNITLTNPNQLHTLSSALNITNNFTLTIGSGSGVAIVTNTFAINISGSLIGSGQLARWSGTGVINMLGTGVINMADIRSYPININTTNIAGYTIGSSTNPTLIFDGSTLNLVGTSVAQVYSTTTHTIRLSSSTLTTNNTATGANIVGGSQIIWGNINASGSSSTLTYDTIALGNLSAGNANINTGRLYVEGNLSATTIGGTSTIELNGSVNTTWGAGTYRNNITINKTSGAVVTITGSVTWGAVGNTLLVPASQTLILSAGLTLNGGTFNCSAGTFTPGVQTVTVNPTATSINMGSTNKFYNLAASAIGAIITMLSKIDVTNNLTLASTSQMNGFFDITVEGNLTTGGGTVSNSTAGRKLTLKGTATGVSTVTNFQSSNIQLEIDCVTRGFALTGTITVASLNYLATNVGSFTTTGSTLSYSLNSSINMNGSTNSWNIVNNLAGSSRILILLSSDLYCVQFGPTSNGDIINSSGGSFFIITTGNTAAMSNISGTAGLRFVGASNAAWNQTAVTSNSMRTIEFAKTLPGTVSIPNSFTYTGILKYVSGAVTHAGTLTLGTGSTVDTTSAVPWNNITIPASATITISSLFYIVGTLAITSGTTTFAGIAGWNCGTLTCAIASSVIVLQTGVTYTTTVNVVMLGTAGTGRITMRSNAPTATYAIWTLQNPASQSMTYVNGQGIDSRPGMTIYTFGGDILTSQPALNWSVGASQGTKAFTFVS